MANSKEAKARLKINKLLEEAGWRFFDLPAGKAGDEKGQANIQLEPNVKLSQKDIDAFGDDIETTKNGFIDFLLLDDKGFPFVVLEAKKEDKNPLDGKEQARRYAQNINARFVILSNGNLHYFWDLERGDPDIVTEYPTQESLLHRLDFKPNNKRLADEEINDDYIALTQNPNFKDDPQYQNEKTRKKFFREQGLRILRPYQLKSIHALQKSAEAGNDRFLFEMATGTGKTLTSAAVIKLFLRTGNAKRILFLVDRLELEDQAYKNFRNYLGNDFQTVIYKQNRDDWKKAEIVVSTVQSLSSQDKYKKLFSPTDFDLLIADESHRAIGGNSRAVFEYFIGYKLGLTATPKNYLKNVDPHKLSSKDPRAWEKRQMLDTYTTFGCKDGEPTFRYSLLDGVKEGFLINPTVVDARTDITADLLSEKGYAVMVEKKEGGDDHPPVDIEEIEVFDPDKIKEMREKAVGLEGMKVDRKLFEKAQQELQKDEDIKTAVENEQWKKVVKIVREKYEDKPQLFLNLEKIRKSENLDCRISWREVLERIFGFIDKFKDKNELLEEECKKFISIYKPESKYVLHIKNFMKANVADEYFRNEINNKRFPRTYAGFTMQEYKELNGWSKTVPEYVKDYVSVNQFVN